MNVLKLCKKYSNNLIKVSKYFLQQNAAYSTTTIMRKDIMKPVVSTTHSEDVLMQNIKSAVDTLDLFDIIGHSQKEMNHLHVMQTLKSLFVLQRSGNSTLRTAEILKHPEFELLCRNLKTHARSIEINDIVESLKVLVYLGVPANSEIAHILLNLLRHQINHVTLGQIVFLDFLLKKCNSTPLVEALKMALPMLFQIQLNTKLDHENVPQLIELLVFISKNQISDQCVMNVISALTLHGETFQAEQAKSIVWSLCDMRKFQPQYEKLLTNAINILNRELDELSFENIESTLSKVIDKFLYKYPVFYKEAFFIKCINQILKMDVGFSKAVYIVKKFNKISFVNIDLLDYIALKCEQNLKLITDAKPSVLFSFVTGFSTANYIPENWDIIKECLVKNELLQSDKNELPWMKFSLELMSLDCYEKSLLEKLFSDDFLDLHLAREYNTLDLIQFLSLYQSVMLLKKDYDGILPNRRHIDRAIDIMMEKDDYPLKAPLEYAFGGKEYICTKVKSSYGHFIDHIVVFNKNNDIVACGENSCDKDAKITDLRKYLLNDDLKVIAVLACSNSNFPINTPRLKGMFELKIKTLEALGVQVVPVNLHNWTKLPDPEKIPYLQREIKYKL